MPVLAFGEKSESNDVWLLTVVATVVDQALTLLHCTAVQTTAAETGALPEFGCNEIIGSRRLQQNVSGWTERVDALSQLGKMEELWQEK